MRLGLRLGSIVLATSLAAFGCDDGGETEDAGTDAARRDSGTDARSADPDSGPPGASFAAACVDGGDCMSGLCYPTAAGMAVCTRVCDGGEDCPAGWDCGDLGGERACACESEPERCNAEDDDCDGIVDEGGGAALGCELGEVCTDGACACPEERMCDPMGGCTDIDSDPLHCGGCGDACAEGERCSGGDCCVPSSETCDGADQNCNGVIDDGARCAAEGEVCTAGACVCPAEHMCGGTCVDTSSDRDHCGGCGISCGEETCVGGVCCGERGSRVDLLFMIDNSNSMSEEQASLTAELPRIVRALATGDVDGDGTAESLPVRDLHVGVVTADMGVGGYTVPTCTRADHGDDGILRTIGRVDAGCMETYPPFLAFEPGSGVIPEDFAAEVACVANAGTGGCGFEQQLEAVLKATTPSTSGIRFFGGTTGHADGVNAGFLRDDSILVVFLLTDENDCSAVDPGMYDPSSVTYAGDLNLRCFNYPGAQHPVARFVDGILALRSDPRDLIFTAVTGIPVDLEPVDGPADYDAILGDARMIEMIDPVMTNRLLPSCNVPGRGLAFPPRRIVLTAQELEDRGVTSVVGSICQESYAAPVGNVLARISERLGEVCRGD
jgi:hypothetical protein